MIVYNLYPHLVGKGWVKKKILWCTQPFYIFKGYRYRKQTIYYEKIFNCFFKFFFGVIAATAQGPAKAIFLNSEVRDLHPLTTTCVSQTRKKDWAQEPAWAGLVLAGVTKEVQPFLYRWL